MSGGRRIPAVHQAILAAVKAVLGERAVVRQIVEVPAGASASRHVVALTYGIHTFWRRWTGRQSNGSLDDR